MTEETSAKVAAIAAKGLANPSSLTPREIQSVCGSCLTQFVKLHENAPLPADPKE